MIRDSGLLFGPPCRPTTRRTWSHFCQQWQSLRMHMPKVFCNITLKFKLHARAMLF